MILRKCDNKQSYGLGGDFKNVLFTNCQMVDNVVGGPLFAKIFISKT